MAHVVAAGAWIGIDVMMAVLVGVGLGSDDLASRAAAFQAIGRFLAVPMLVVAIACLATGLVLGWGTRWGLLRFWWVTIKLVINAVLVALVGVALLPGMGEVREHGESLAATGAATGDMSFLVFPPAVSLLALLVATVLSVFKPWGRVRPPAGRGA
ncbi:hypothetical protein I6A84_28295 [Frankia sp. CNm7]|nr:hypothetical protein [Frankia nepalensis]MBL7515814.1 hypothetical protein [Frankia nepalensis]MBL7521875.1 hypothetical protein [Frankia nepalensis]